MKSIRKVAAYDDVDIDVYSPFSQEVIDIRHKEYFSLSDIEFMKKYRTYLYEPAILNISGESIPIQLNTCYNPFCKWYGLPQKKYSNIKNTPSRYKMVSKTSYAGLPTPMIMCNNIEDKEYKGIAPEHTNELVSNWSVAEEIRRLIKVNTVVPMETEYSFHKPDCNCSGVTPMDSPDSFYKRGKSSSNSPKYQCKQCKKITNVMPEQHKSFNYHQKRNNILIDFTKDLLSRAPIKRTCEKLEIANGTYYNKLEWVYKKCLEFLERHETLKLKSTEFEDFWLNSDTLSYNLNNVKLKGRGGKKSLGTLDKKLQTSIIASAEVFSGYVLRCDVAYDFDVTLKQIEEDTEKYRCDHSYSFLRKNGRLRYSYAPQLPTNLDAQTQEEYLDFLTQFNVRKNYIEGLHVRTQYNAIAHYLLLDRLLKVRGNYYFVSDDDVTLQSSIFRVFPDKFKNNGSIYFTCQADKSLSLDDAGKKCFEQRKELNEWGERYCPNALVIGDTALMKLIFELEEHDFFEYKYTDEVPYRCRGKNPIKHPLPSKDEGVRFVNVISPLKGISKEKLAELILNVNSRATDNFFQSIRRRLSILERPLVTSRGDGKSYIYSNYNPKYAQYAVTILRTFYNFCFPQGKLKDKPATPAMKLGIADKVYNYKDIIYFR